MSSRPKNKNEYREELAEAFAHVLEEKGLDWKKEWRGSGGGAPFNGITKANYRGCNSFWLSLVSMMKGYDDPRWVTMVQIMDKDNKYHPNEQWHLKKGSEASYVEYWYPYDPKEKKALTWDQFKYEIKNNGRKEDEFKLSTRYTAVFTFLRHSPLTANTLITQQLFMSSATVPAILRDLTVRRVASLVLSSMHTRNWLPRCVPTSWEWNFQRKQHLNISTIIRLTFSPGLR